MVYCVRTSGEVAHECRVGVGVGEGRLELGLPGHLHQVDGDTAVGWVRGGGVMLGGCARGDMSLCEVRYGEVR